MVAPVRTDAGLWAVLEVWSDFRDAFTAQDVKLLDKVAGALGRKTPAA
jgi:putative methionine-R-sulfoxide reductase with GAF domain